MPIKVPVVQTGLEASIQAAAKKAGKAMKIDMGAGAKSIEGLSQPLGRITGKADQFTKSMEAANARVLAFGASVGVLSAVTRGFQELVRTTIEVEKQLASINSILNVSASQLNSFKKEIFEVARSTEQSFSTVADAALELSRQGLKAEEVTKRLSDAMILSRLSGLGAAEAVAGMTAAINSFNREGVTSEQVLNKLSAASVKAAVSERDLIEGLKRSASVAVQAGVSLDELVGVITAVQQKTARGGAVIGNSFKTIFTRIQSLEKLKTMRNLGVQVTDLQGEVLSGTKLIENLANTIKSLPDARKLQIAEGLVGKFQVAPFLAILDDYSQKTSTAIRITGVSQQATEEAYTRNIALNQTLSAALNQTVLNVKELANTLGEIGVTENLQNVLGFFSSLVEKVKGVMEGEGIGSDFARGIVKGIGNIISGPGLAIAGAIIAKLTIDLARFGVGSLQTFFGLNKAAKEQATLQGQIASTLLGNKEIQQHILNIERSSLSAEQKKIEQTKFFTIALKEQLGIMTTMQGIAAKVAPGVARGTRGGGRGRAAGGYIPNFDAVRGYGSEQASINRGVGGAPKGARPVTIPNFNFGGGQRGTMVANDSEFIVDNFKGKGGSAIFNQNMVSSMGLPTGARKIGAAGGYIPNFQRGRGTPSGRQKTQGFSQSQTFNLDRGFVLLTATRGPDNPQDVVYVHDKSPAVAGGETFAETPFTLTPEMASKGEIVGVVNVPTFNIPDPATAKGESQKQRARGLDIDSIGKKVKDRATRMALANARLMSGPINMPSAEKRQMLNQRHNPGAVGGMAGSTFEVSLAALLSDRRFDDYSALVSNAPIDLVGRSSGLYSVFGVPPGQGDKGAEVKAHQGLAMGAARKFYNVSPKRHKLQGQKHQQHAFPFKKGEMQGLQIGRQGAAATGLPASTPFHRLTSEQRDAVINRGGSGMMMRGGRLVPVTGRTLGYSGGAGGYIPNYADPLQDAIGRERNAGLPLNQIRVNQDTRLRNVDNPQGLAVTNMRDEPTGRIPSFAKKLSGGKGDDPMTAASGDLMMKFMGLTMAASMLQGVFSQVGEETSNFNQGMSRATQALMMLAMVSMMGGGGGPGKVSQWGTNMMLAGRSGLAGPIAKGSGGINPATGQTIHSRRIPASGMKKGLAIGKIGVGGIVKGAAAFGRFLPILGQVIFSFQILSGVLKMFGVDVNKGLGKMFKDFGMALNIVDTPAEKAAKAMDGLTDAIYKNAAAQGFGAERADAFFKALASRRGEKRAKGQLSGDERDDLEKGDSARDKLLENIMERGAVDFSMADIASSVTRDVGIGWDAQGKHIKQRFNLNDAAQVDMSLLGQVGPSGNVAGAGRATQGGRAGLLPARLQNTDLKRATLHEFEINERLDDFREKYEAALEEGTEALGKLHIPKGFSGVMSGEQREQLGGARLAAVASFATKEQRERIEKATEAGDKEQIKAISEEVIGGLDPKQLEVYLRLTMAIITNSDDLPKIQAEWNKLKGEGIAKQETELRIIQIQERLAKTRIANMVEIQKIQSQMVGWVELEEKGRLSLLSTSLKERGVIGKNLRDAEEKRKLIGEQINLTSKLVESESAFAFTMKAKGVTEDIPIEDYTAIKAIVGETNEDLKAQGGWNATIQRRLVSRIKAETGNAELAKNVADLLKEQSEQVRKKLLLEKLGSTRKLFQKTIDESILKTQKRTLEVLKAQLSVSADLKKISVSKAKSDLRISNLEGQKVGAGRGRELEIEKLISAEREKQARLTHRAAKKSIREGVRQELFARAQEGGLDLGQLSMIQGELKAATNVEQFREIADGIDEMSKKQQVADIKRIADEKVAVLEKIQLEKLGADYVYDALVEGGKSLYTAFSWVDGVLATQNQREMMDIREAVGRQGGGIENATPAQIERMEELLAIKEARKARGRQREQTERNRATDIDNARKRAKAAHDAERSATLQASKDAQARIMGGAGVPSPKLDEMVDDFKLAALQMRKEIKDIANALAEGADFLNTFEEQVVDFVFNLAQGAEDLKFQGFGTTSASGILQNARDKDENRRLQQLATRGLTAQQFAQQGIAAGAEGRAIKDLEDSAFLSPTAAGARSFTRQIPVLKKIFDLKAKMNEQNGGTIEQQQELLRLEKERLTVNDSLSAKLEDAFVFTQEEIQNQLNTTLADGAAQFTKKMSDGLVDAIAKGQDLGDTLRDAATEFFTTMAKGHMDAAFKRITSAFGGIGGGGGGGGGGFWSALGFNSGGLIRGGSGNRDDVPTLLTGGEFVVRKGAVEKYGTQFFEGLNTGRVGQMQRGGSFYRPGTHGLGAIQGTENLLAYAGQAATSGTYDRLGGGARSASVSLEARSGRLTRFGDKSSLAADLERQAQGDAATLAFDQIKYEAELKKQERERKKAFKRSIFSAIASVGINQFATGFSESMQAGQGFKKSMGAGFTGFEFGGERHGGLLNFGRGGGTLPSAREGRPQVEYENFGDFWSGIGRSYAGGGYVSPTAGVDTVPSMLSGGEFVMNAAATQNIGRGNLAALNSGGGGDGGDGAIVAAINNLGDELGNSGETTINITVNSDGTETQDGNGVEEAQTLAVKIRDVVKQTIVEEQRLGGSLRRQ